jgi:putative ABC transport system substrate-binding protein
VIDRRTFNVAVGSLAVMAMLRARAEPAGRVWRLGYLVLNPVVEPPSPERAAFLDALRDLGYSVGRNIAITYRSADNDTERLQFLADELVQSKVDALAVTSSDAAIAAVNASKTIPVVMLGVADPVAVGLVKNLARPGSNITGMSWHAVDITAKRFGLLKEMLPRAARIAFMWNPATPIGEANTSAARQAARQAGVALDELPLVSGDDVASALPALKRNRPDALYVVIDTRTAPYRKVIADEALRLRIPSMSTYRGYVEVGGLFSYAASLTDLYARAATYVDRIFKGAKPGDLAIEQPTKYEFVVNLRTAKALGITIPSPVLLRADDVIQ